MNKEQIVKIKLWLAKNKLLILFSVFVIATYAFIGGHIVENQQASLSTALQSSNYVISPMNSATGMGIVTKLDNVCNYGPAVDQINKIINSIDYQSQLAIKAYKTSSCANGNKSTTQPCIQIEDTLSNLFISRASYSQELDRINYQANQNHCGTPVAYNNKTDKKFNILNNSLGALANIVLAVTNSSTLHANCTVPSNNITVGMSVVYRASVSGGSGNYSYTWANSWSGPSANGSTMSKTFTAPGIYTASVIVYSGATSATASCPSITVAQTSGTGTNTGIGTNTGSGTNTPLSATCSTSSSSTILSRAVTYSASASGGNGIYSYSWSGPLGNTASVSRIFPSAGTYSGSVTVSSGGQTATALCPTVTVTSTTGGGSGAGSGTGTETGTGTGNINLPATNNVIRPVNDPVGLSLNIVESALSLGANGGTDFGWLIQQTTDSKFNTAISGGFTYTPTNQTMRALVVSWLNSRINSFNTSLPSVPVPPSSDVLVDILMYPGNINNKLGVGATDPSSFINSTDGTIFSLNKYATVATSAISKLNSIQQTATSYGFSDVASLVQQLITKTQLIIDLNLYGQNSPGTLNQGGQLKLNIKTTDQLNSFIDGISFSNNNSKEIVRQNLENNIKVPSNIITVYFDTANNPRDDKYNSKIGRYQDYYVEDEVIVNTPMCAREILADEQNVVQNDPLPEDSFLGDNKDGICSILSAAKSLEDDLSFNDGSYPGYPNPTLNSNSDTLPRNTKVWSCPFLEKITQVAGVPSGPSAVQRLDFYTKNLTKATKVNQYFFPPNLNEEFIKWFKKNDGRNCTFNSYIKVDDQFFGHSSHIVDIKQENGKYNVVIDNMLDQGEKQSVLGADGKVKKINWYVNAPVDPGQTTLQIDFADNKTLTWVKDSKNVRGDAGNFWRNIKLTSWIIDCVVPEYPGKTPLLPPQDVSDF